MPYYEDRTFDKVTILILVEGSLQYQASYM